MLNYFTKSFLLLAFAVVTCCILYPLAVWIVGQVFFPFQANGSLILDSDGKPIGSKLIAQSFTLEAYFHPRPSAASYNAAASASSSLAPSNYALRKRVTETLLPIVTYKTGPKAGKPVAPDIDDWFNGKQVNLQTSSLFDIWLQEHPEVGLAPVPGDLVTTSASGLDPHITLENAKFQLDRVVTAWTSHLKRDTKELKLEIEQLLDDNASAPFGGLAGEKIVNVLEVNLELRKRYGEPI